MSDVCQICGHTDVEVKRARGAKNTRRVRRQFQVARARRRRR